MKTILFLISIIITCQSCTKEFGCKCMSSVGESHTTVNAKNKKGGEKACKDLTFSNNNNVTVYSCE